MSGWRGVIVSVRFLVLTSGLLWVCQARSTQLHRQQHTSEQKRFLLGSSSVCYGSLGCFDNNPPFWSLYRPITFLPQSPQTIKPTFTLYSRASPTTGHQLWAGAQHPQVSPGMTLFNASKPTKFIVHGFVDSSSIGLWMMDMVTEFLRHGDYNVVIVDWIEGSFNIYGKATANTRVVGAMIAQLITYLQNTTGARPEDMHIIGHSLGAHIAGYAGERLRYLGRITGLDPAEPYFQYMDKVVRLDPSDALFVDVIHTDGASFYSSDTGFGMSQACGHVDFYVNGGHDQPGCDKSPVYNIVENGLLGGALEIVACNHLRAYRLFTESINSKCQFPAYRCSSEDEFNKGHCIPCQGQEDCSFMGLNADRVKGSQPLTKYYLRTGDKTPFCRHHYKLSMAFSDSPRARQERGSLYLTVYGSNGTIPEIKLNDDDFYIQPGATYEYVVTSPTDIGHVVYATFRWVHTSSLLRPGDWNPFNFRKPTVYVNTVEVVGRQRSSTTSLCGNGIAVKTGVSQNLRQEC